MDSFSIDEKEFVSELINLNLLEYDSKQCSRGDISELKTEKSRITFAWIEVTDKCNLQCIHCYESSCPQQESIMSLADFKYVIEQLKEIGVEKIQIIGGEPLVLGEYLKSMLDEAVKLFTSIEIFTNGTLLSDEYVNYFSNNNIKVALSVYSYNETEHDKVTKQKGSYKRTEEAIRKLRENGIKYRVANVRMKDIDVGVKSTDLFDLDSKSDVVRMTGRSSYNLLSYELFEKKLIRMERFESPLRPGFVKNAVNGHNCFSRRLYIASDLTVYPCVMERKLSHGNLKMQKLSELLKKELLGMNKERISTCKECEYRYACHDCRPDRITDDVYTKPWYCTYNPYTGIWDTAQEHYQHLLENGQIGEIL